jgi:hypothetical protein
VCSKTHTANANRARGKKKKKKEKRKNFLVKLELKFCWWQVCLSLVASLRDKVACLTSHR